MVFLQNSSTPLLYKLKDLQCASNHPLKNYDLVCNTIYYMCMQPHKTLHNETQSVTDIN